MLRETRHRGYFFAISGTSKKNGTDTVFPKTEKSAVGYLLQIIELPVRNAEPKRELALLRQREEFPMGEIFLK